MIQLFRIGLVNWHLLPDMDIDVGGDIGVIGENRSGKSTLLDLIQTVMTGNDGQYLRLNASANDSGRKRGMRSVHAYCLGRLGPDTVERREAKSYIFLGFRDAARPETLTTIGLALEAAERETKEHVQAQFIARGHALSVNDLIYDKPDGGKGVRDWGVFRPILERLCSEAGGGLHTYRDEPRKFVADYLKALSTGSRFVVVDQVMKAFVNAISFEQIPNATEFVRRYLLEKDDVRISQLRTSINTYHQLMRDIKALREKLTRLEEMDRDIAAHKATVAAYHRAQWLEARAGLEAAGRLKREARRKSRTALADIAEADREIAEYGRLIGEAEEERDALQAAIARETQGGRMQELKQQRRALTLELSAAMEHIKRCHTGTTQGLSALRHRDVLADQAPRLTDPLARLATVSGTALPPAWPSDPQAMAAALDDPALAGVSEAAGLLRVRADDLVKEQGLPEKARVDLLAQIRDIREKGVTLDPNVARLVEELEERGFRPRIVGHLLRVTDERWRDAVEALLGRDREAVLVDDAHVDDAIRHLQASRRRLRGCRIVNTRKIDTTKNQAEPGTLASVLASDDAAAMAFVIRRIGNVRLAETLDNLHRPGRAIMTDGTYDDGLAVEMREVQGGYRIGAGAGRTSLPALEAEVARLGDEIKALTGRISAHRAVATALDALAGHAGTGAALLEHCTKLETVQVRLDQVTADMADLERNISPDLKKRLEDVKGQLKIYDGAKTEAVEKRSDARNRNGEATKILNGGDGQAGSKWHHRRAVDKWRDRRPLVAPEDRADVIAEARKLHRGDLDRIAREAAKEVTDLHDTEQKSRNALFDLYVQYHVAVGTRSEFARESMSITGDLAPWIDANIRHIRGTELVQYEAEAAEAAEKTRNIFQHSFAYELRRRFGKMDRALDKLNRSLRDHEFHYERYRFTSRPVEAMRDIIALIRASEADDTLFATLFDQQAADETHPHAKALATVRELLLDDAVDLSEFEDYRRYYTFNLIMKDVKTGRETDLETRRGTGSGAEQQVPFYVAIGSALATAYHDKDAGDPAVLKGLGLAVFDEAFSKLDGKNQKACMDFYRKLGLQVIVAAPLEKRATLYETMTTFVETIRNGDAVDVEHYIIGDRTRQAFTEANPSNVSIEDFRRYMANEKVAEESTPEPAPAEPL